MAVTTYMIVEHFRNGDAVPVYRRFRERGLMAPEGLTYVTSWVTSDLSRCFQVDAACAGFKAGTGDAHHLANRTQADVLFLEVGDRSAGDSVNYPDDDVVGSFTPDGKWQYTRKDGTPY